MNLPASLQQLLVAKLGAEIRDTAPVGGGDISQAVRLALADGRQVLLKWQMRGGAEMFAAEQRGLDLLRAAESTLRVPQVLARDEATAGGSAFIVLEWLGQGTKSATAAERLGHGLAQLHRTTGERYGLDHDNFIGANPQPNLQADNWVDFFRGQRLGFQVDVAGRRGYLSSGRIDLFETLLARLGDWLPADPPASLLHGDLWGGNWLVAETGEPALIDPAVYYGHRETDLAFTELFGGFPPTFYAAYRQSWPLEPGYDERKHLYNLYHLLNHLNLFGRSYLASIVGILERFCR